MLLLEVLEVFVRGLHQHHRGIDHRTQRDGHTRQTEDVRADALPMHHDEGGEHTDRQRDHRHPRRAQVKQEQRAHQCHDDEFFDQLVAQVDDGAVDQFGAVVGLHHFHAARQAGLERLQLRFDRVDGGARVLPRAHHHHAARHFALAVELGDAAAHLGAHLNDCDIAQQDRCRPRHRQRYGAKVFERLQEAARAHHVLGLGQFDHRPAGGLVGLLQGLHHRGLGHPEHTHAIRVEHHLVLLDHAADAGHFGHVAHRLQLELQKPVVERSQLTQIIVAGAVDQRVFVDPAHARGVGPQRGGGTGGQSALHLVEVFHHARARPVGVGLVVEQHVNERVAEERIAAHRLRARHAEHRRGQRVGDEVFHHLRRLAGIRGAHDDLRVRQVGDRIDARVLDGPDPCHHQERSGHEHQESVADRPADQRGNHLAPAVRCTETSSQPIEPPFLN